MPKPIMEDVAVTVRIPVERRQLAWQPYRPPVRFDRLGRFGYGYAVFGYRGVLMEGRTVHPEADGVVFVDDRNIVEAFLEDLAAYPVFVPVRLYERFAMVAAADRHQVPVEHFMNGIGFRTIREAVLVKLAA